MLTPKQKEVFVYIKSYIGEKGTAPSLQEIREHFSLASVSTADYYVRRLIAEKCISRPKGRARSIEINEPVISHTTPRSFSMRSRNVVPLVGNANAGSALEVAEEQIEGYVEIPDSVTLTDSLFALRVKGDSMERETLHGKNIIDGAIVLVDSSQQVPTGGEVVLSIINGCANIKKIQFDRDKNVVKLCSNSNSTDHKPIFLNDGDDFQVNGKVINVL